MFRSWSNYIAFFLDSKEDHEARINQIDKHVIYFTLKKQAILWNSSSREIDVSDVSPMKLTISFFENYKMYFNSI